MSQTTVSLVLNGRRDVSLPESTRQRVRQAAAELGYRPNRLARSLVVGHSRVLGTVMYAGPGDGDAPLLQGIEAAARNAGYLFMLGFTSGLTEAERQLAEAIWDQGVDGLIVFPAQPVANADLYAHMQQQGFPLVFVGEAGSVPGDVVQTNNHTGGYQIARHLIEKGCRDLVFLRGEYMLTFPWCEARRAGASQALREAGLPDPVVLTAPGVPAADPEGLREVLAQHLSGGGRMDALFGAHDKVALPALRAVAQLGLRVREPRPRRGMIGLLHGAADQG